MSNRRRRVAAAAGWCLAVGMVGRHGVGLWQLRRTLRYMHAGASAAVNVAAGTRPVREPCQERVDPPRLHMILPVLGEQEHVPAALEWFARVLRALPGATLTLVTTARETREREHLAHTRACSADRHPAGAIGRSALAVCPTTADVVTSYLAAQVYRDLAIRHVHYPGSGRKAAQVNFAASTLPAEPGDYIVVYDVDSRPTLEILYHTLRFVAGRQRLDGVSPGVVQQPAAFATAGDASRWWEREACRGAALCQTLWTLRREIPAVRRAGNAMRRPTGLPVVDVVRRGLGIAVGHGLLVRRDVFDHSGGFPEYTTLDDLPFGYRLTVADIPVHVVPVLSTVPSPETVSELVAMHRRWFVNYLEYPRCRAAAHADGCGTPTGRAAALLTGSYRGLAWLAASPATAATLALVVAPKTGWRLRAVAAVGLWLEVVAPVRMLAAADDCPATVRSIAVDSARLLAGYLLKSGGPLVALGAAAVTALHGDHDRDALSPRTRRRTHSPLQGGRS